MNNSFSGNMGRKGFLFSSGWYRTVFEFTGSHQNLEICSKSAWWLFRPFTLTVSCISMTFGNSDWANVPESIATLPSKSTSDGPQFPDLSSYFLPVTKKNWIVVGLKLLVYHLFQAIGPFYLLLYHNDVYCLLPPSETDGASLIGFLSFLLDHTTKHGHSDDACSGRNRFLLKQNHSFPWLTFSHISNYHVIISVIENGVYVAAAGTFCNT